MAEPGHAASDWNLGSRRRLARSNMATLLADLGRAHGVAHGRAEAHTLRTRSFAQAMLADRMASPRPGPDGGLPRHPTSRRRHGDYHEAVFGAREFGGTRSTVAPLTGGLAPDLALTLRSIVESAAEQVSAQFAILIANIPGDNVSRFVTFGFPEDRDMTYERRALDGLDDLLELNSPARIDDLIRYRVAHGLPPRSSVLTSLICAPVHLDEQLYGHLYLANKRGSGAFTADDEEPVFAMAAAAAAAIENARLFNVEQRRQQWLEAALEMTRVLLSDAERSEAARVAVRLLRDVAAADYTALVLLDDAYPGGAIAFEAVEGLDMGHLAGTPGRLQGIAAQVAATGEGVVSARITKEPAFDPPVPVAEALSVLGPGMYLPLAAAGRVFGVLVVGWRRGASAEHVAPTEVWLVEMIAGQVALALQQIQARSLVVEDRDRIAHDLREVTVGRIFAVDAHLLSTVAMISEPDARDRVNEAINELRDTNLQLRSAISTLDQAETSEPRSASGLMLDEIDAARTTLGLTPRLVIHGPLDRDLPPYLRRELAGGLREALANAASREAQSSVEVDVNVTASEVTVRVSDDGQPLEQQPIGGALSQLRARSERLGGSCGVRLEPPGTTVVEWMVPLTIQREDVSR